MPLPRRVTPSPTGSGGELFRADFGTLDVGYYTASVVRGAGDKVLAETAIEVRDPWFERLELDARPDVMRRVAEISGGQALEPRSSGDLAEAISRTRGRRPPNKRNSNDIVGPARSCS